MVVPAGSAISLAAMTTVALAKCRSRLWPRKICQNSRWIMGSGDAIFGIFLVVLVVGGFYFALRGGK